MLPGGEPFSVANDQAGIDELLARLAQPGAPPELVVLEATGRYERPAAAAIATAGIAVAVVNPRQTRDFAKATGRLAKTDKIDARLLARFAEAVGPTPSVLPDEESQALQAILTRRRQLLEMLVAEKNRLLMATKGVTRRIRAHIRWLEKEEIDRADRELEEAIEASAAFKENEVLLRSVRAWARSWRERCLPSCPSCARCPTSASRPWWGSHLSTATPAPSEENARCGAGGLR